MTWDYCHHAPGRHLVERSHPVLMVRVAIPKIISRPPVDAQIACEKDLFVRQIGDCISDGVRRADFSQLKAALAIIEREEIAESDCRLLHTVRRQTVLAGRGIAIPFALTLGPQLLGTIL